MAIIVVAMLKFILLVIVFFMAIRLVMRIVRSGLFFMGRGGRFRRSERSSASVSSRRDIDEIEYEEIESHLHNKEPDER